MEPPKEATRSSEHDDLFPQANMSFARPSQSFSTPRIYFFSKFDHLSFIQVLLSFVVKFGLIMLLAFEFFLKVWIESKSFKTTGAKMKF